MAVTESLGYPKGRKHDGMKFDFIDVRRAYYHADARIEIYVQPPDGDKEKGMCGKLNRALQGTRDAAQCWEAEHLTVLTSIGFQRGTSFPCAFYHEDKSIRLVVHGDDFTALAYTNQLDWLRGQLSAKWTIKHRGRIGPAPNDDKAITILNRILEWTDEGIQYEADSRHVQFILESLEIEPNSKSFTTLGNNDHLPLDGNRLTAEQSTMFRANVARAIYLSQDRTDIQFAVKALSRSMATP